MDISHRKAAVCPNANGKAFKQFSSQDASSGSRSDEFLFTHKLGKLNIIDNYIVDIKFSCKSVLGAYLNICKKFSVVSINSCSKGDMERRKVGGKPESSLPFRSMKESVKFIWFVTQFLSICSNLEQEDPRSCYVSQITDMF